MVIGDWGRGNRGERRLRGSLGICGLSIASWHRACGQMSVPTAMDGDEDVIIVKSNSMRAVRRCVSGAEISARGLGTGALPFSHSCLPRLLSLLLLHFILHRETWAKGSALAPSEWGAPRDV